MRGTSSSFKNTEHYVKTSCALCIHAPWRNGYLRFWFFQTNKLVFHIHISLCRIIQMLFLYFEINSFCILKFWHEMFILSNYFILFFNIWLSTHTVNTFRHHAAFLKKIFFFFLTSCHRHPEAKNVCKDIYFT